MKYEVFLTLTGYVEIEAKSPYEAGQIALDIPEDKINWSDNYDEIFVQWEDADGRLCEYEK